LKKKTSGTPNSCLSAGTTMLALPLLPPMAQRASLANKAAARFHTMLALHNTGSVAINTGNPARSGLFFQDRTVPPVQIR
jgi:hypothetical protein